jgi:hypothetical protein
MLKGIRPPGKIAGFLLLGTYVYQQQLGKKQPAIFKKILVPLKNAPYRQIKVHEWNTLRV